MCGLVQAGCLEHKTRSPTGLTSARWCGRRGGDGDNAGWALVANFPTSFLATFVGIGLCFGMLNAILGCPVTLYVAELFPKNVRFLAGGMCLTGSLGLTGGIGPYICHLLANNGALPPALNANICPIRMADISSGPFCVLALVSHWLRVQTPSAAPHWSVRQAASQYTNKVPQ